MAEINPSVRTSASILPPVVRARPMAVKAGKTRPVSSKAGWLTGFLAGILFCIFAVSIFGALVWFNVSGLQTRLVATLKLDKAELAWLESQRNVFGKLEADLIEQKRQLDSDQLAADKQLQDAATAREDLAVREFALKEQTAQFTEQKTSLNAAVSLLEAMEPKSAAQIITAGNNLNQQLPILKQMNKDKLAFILAEMPPALASKLVTMIAGDLTVSP